MVGPRVHRAMVNGVVFGANLLQGKTGLRACFLDDVHQHVGGFVARAVRPGDAQPGFHSGIRGATAHVVDGQSTILACFDFWIR